MIGFIHGVALHCENGIASFAVGNVGYEVHICGSVRVWEVNSDVNNELWWIHEHAPQDAPHELYGFRERVQRDLFRRLLDIKGVGPKVAMAVVTSGISGPSCDIAACNCGGGNPMCQKRTVDKLTRLRGVGRTLADRIVEALR